MFVSVNDYPFLSLDKITEQLDKLYNTELLFGVWCNSPVRGSSLDLQVDVGTSSRIGDDDALSSC